MSVTPIHSGIRVPRKNRPEDGTAIKNRSWLRTAEKEPEAPPSILALESALREGLPAARLRCLVGTLDERRDFALRLAELEIARHEAEAYRARVHRCRILHGKEAAEDMFPENDHHWERFRTAMMDMAQTPARTEGDLRRKRYAIGTVWFRAEGEWYDQLRAGVSRDREWLDANRPRR